LEKTGERGGTLGKGEKEGGPPNPLLENLREWVLPSFLKEKQKQVTRMSNRRVREKKKNTKTPPFEPLEKRWQV